MTLKKTLMTLIPILALIMQATAGTAAEPPTHTALARAAIDKHIIPHIEALRDAAHPLQKAVADVCRTGSAASSVELKKRFDKAVLAFAGVDFLRFGPMLEGGRREQISFWPDPRGFVGRQLRLVLLNKDPALLQPGAIRKQSAAVQGLSALEVLMLDKDVPLGPSEPAHYRCALAGAIAANVASLSDEVVDGWEKPGGWKDKMLHPGPDNDTYKNAGESAVEIVKALLAGLSLTADLQIKPQIDPKVKLAPPYQKSGLQKDFYRATIVSLRELYDALQLEDYLKPDKAWMKNWLSGAWRTIQSTDGVGGRSPNAERADAPPLREVFDKTNGLRNLVNNQLSMSAGLTVGFNELDGD
jgi:predicted lipoprotein